MSEEKSTKLVIANAPEEQPVAIDIVRGKLYLDKDLDSDEFAIPLDSPSAIINLKGQKLTNPKWVSEFFEQMSGYVRTANPNADIDKNGQLILSPNIPKSGLKQVCNNLAWLYEAQYRQNKEILIWIGEVILDFIARDTRGDMSVEEAIEQLGLLDRENGVKWKLRTLVKWPLVVQKIPHEIRQLPIPPTYLALAAEMKAPDDPNDRKRFSNARDALLVAVADKPDCWSRTRFANCMKELQEHFDVERSRNEGVAALMQRLISYYRLQREAGQSPDQDRFYQDLGLDRKEVASWIISIEAALQDRGKLPSDPMESIPRGDGLTETARKRVSKITSKHQSSSASKSNE